MTYFNRIDVPVVTDGASAADLNTSVVLNGLLYAVRFMPSTVNPWTTAADFAITKVGGEEILHVDLNASASGQTFYPRQSANGTNSATFDPSGNTSGRAAVQHVFANELARIVVASGGATTSGTVRFYLG